MTTASAARDSFVTDAEFVSQYVLVTNQFGPEYGRNSGSVVNVVTKSGSNAWHGSIFGSENNSILNSLNNFDKNPESAACCGWRQPWRWLFDEAQPPQ